MLPRIIPVLLLSPDGVVKTQRFRDPKYVGDPINALRVFNEKEVDEIVILDIDATREGRAPNVARAQELAGECFMPIAFGGGIRTPQQAEALFAVGVEKVVIGSGMIEATAAVTEIARAVGAQSVAGCLDVKRTWLGRYEVCIRNGRVATGKDPVELARKWEQCGVGEIIIQSIDRDGTMTGYDLAMIEKVAAAVRIPVVACGGAGKLDDFAQAIRSGATAAAAGSMFVFHGKHRAVLITYPTPAELSRALTPA